MTTEVDELTELAYEGSSAPLTTTPVVGSPALAYVPLLRPGAEPVGPEEIRVTILGSGDPFVTRSQASASVLIEVGNEQRDFFFFDLGSGSVANFNGLHLPVTATTKVFLTHLHADHVGDMPTLIWSLAKAGRRDPVEVWGPAGERPELGTRAYAEHLTAAHAWDMQSLCGHPGQSGARMVTTEVPYDATGTVYERGGVRISSFPVIHILNGAVGYRLDYAGRSVVFSGDTRPCRNLVEAADGVDLLIHETFPAPEVYARKAGVPRRSPRRSSTQFTRVPPWPEGSSGRPARGCRSCGISPWTTRRPARRTPACAPSTRARSPSPRTSRCSTSRRTPSSPGRWPATRTPGPLSDRPCRPARPCRPRRSRPHGGRRHS